jgi:hypothetical protein
LRKNKPFLKLRVLRAFSVSPWLKNKELKFKLFGLDDKKQAQKFCREPAICPQYIYHLFIAVRPTDSYTYMVAADWQDAPADTALPDCGADNGHDAGVFPF